MHPVKILISEVRFLTLRLKCFRVSEGKVPAEGEWIWLRWSSVIPENSSLSPHRWGWGWGLSQIKKEWAPLRSQFFRRPLWEGIYITVKLLFFCWSDLPLKREATVFSVSIQLNVNATTTSPASHDIVTVSFWCCCDVMTSQRHRKDVVTTLYVHLEYPSNASEPNQSLTQIGSSQPGLAGFSNNARTKLTKMKKYNNHRKYQRWYRI